MNQALRARIIEYNKAVKRQEEKAGDMDALVGVFLTLPPQIRQILATDKVLEILQKYGFDG